MCGAGGNAIQFAMTCNNVIAIDIDINKINMAKHNAKIYGVENKIEFICCDYFIYCKKMIPLYISSLVSELFQQRLMKGKTFTQDLCG